MWRAPLRARVTPRGRPSRRTCGLHRCPVRLPCAAGGQGACARRRGARRIEWEGGVGDVLGLLGSAPKRRVAPSGRAAAAVGARLGPRARWWG